MDGLADRETNTAKEQTDLRSLGLNESCAPDHQLVSRLIFMDFLVVKDDNNVHHLRSRSG